MTDERDDIDERLARLLGATESVGAKSAFEARVMAAIEAEPIASRFWAGLPRAAKLFVPVAALAAAASVAWAVVAAHELDDASLATQGEPEQSVVSTIAGAEVE